MIAALVIAVLGIGLATHQCSTDNGHLVRKPLTDNPDDPDDATPPSHVVIDQNGGIPAFLSAFDSPIELYGKVVDQFGDPVPGASITLTPTDAPFGDGSRSRAVILSDSSGEFSVKGLKGAFMGVRAEKDGYMDIPRLGGPASSATVEYSGDAQSGKLHSRPSTPLVLTLHKVGDTGPIFYVERKGWRLPVDGTPRRIALDSEDGTGIHEIEFRFWSEWNQLPKSNEMYGKLYNWTFEARIPGGGFIWNDGDFNFEAPESGYKEMIRYHFPADLPREKWKRVQHGRYFVRFANGTHARIEFDIDGKSDVRPLRMASWMSLKPGSRNLASAMKSSHMFFGEDPDKN